jgi:hypothetical protein
LKALSLNAPKNWAISSEEIGNGLELALLVIAGTCEGLDMQNYRLFVHVRRGSCRDLFIKHGYMIAACP